MSLDSSESELSKIGAGACRLAQLNTAAAGMVTPADGVMKRRNVTAERVIIIEDARCIAGWGSQGVAKDHRLENFAGHRASPSGKGVRSISLPPSIIMHVMHVKKQQFLTDP